MPKSFNRPKPVIHGGVEVPTEQLRELERVGVFLRRSVEQSKSTELPKERAAHPIGSETVSKVEQSKSTELPKEQLHELAQASFFEQFEQLKRSSKK